MKNTLLLAILTLAYCSSQAQSPTSAPALMSEITFYGKPRWYVGQMGRYLMKIRSSDGTILKVRENKTKTIQLQPGEYTFSSKVFLNPDKRTSSTINLEPNKKYLISVSSKGMIAPKTQYKLESTQILNPKIVLAEIE